MSYVEKHLMPGEQIEYRANLHWLVFLLPILLFIPAVWLFSIGGNIAKAALQNKKPTKFETNFISFRQTAGLPPIMSLHRYWIYSNRMREYFEVALTKARQNFTNVAKETDPVKVTLAAPYRYGYGGNRYSGNRYYGGNRYYSGNRYSRKRYDGGHRRHHYYDRY